MQVLVLPLSALLLGKPFHLLTETLKYQVLGSPSDSQHFGLPTAGALSLEMPSLPSYR